VAAEWDRVGALIRRDRRISVPEVNRRVAGVRQRRDSDPCYKLTCCRIVGFALKGDAGCGFEADICV